MAGWNYSMLKKRRYYNHCRSIHASCAYTKGKVYPNYYVVVGEDWHFYSVPWQYIGKEVRIVYDSDLLEICYEHERIAFHSRSYKAHDYTTRLEHMPENHKRMAERKGWNPDYYLKKASENV